MANINYQKLIFKFDLGEYTLIQLPLAANTSSPPHCLVLSSSAHLLLDASPETVILHFASLLLRLHIWQ
jgi:hypothetical protein